MVDSREPKTMDPRLEALGFSVFRQALPTGDYLWETKSHLNVCVERKTASDLLSSISGKQANGKSRLQNQMDRLRQFDVPVLLIEGYFHPRRDGFAEVRIGQATGWWWDSVDGVLLSLQRAGIIIARCPADRAPERMVTLKDYFDKPEHTLLKPAPQSGTLEKTKEDVNVQDTHS